MFPPFIDTAEEKKLRAHYLSKKLHKFAENLKVTDEIAINLRLIHMKICTDGAEMKLTLVIAKQRIIAMYIVPVEVVMAEQPLEVLNYVIGKRKI